MRRPAARIRAVGRGYAPDTPRPVRAIAGRAVGGVAPTYGDGDIAGRAVGGVAPTYGKARTLLAVTHGRFTCGRNRLPSQAGAPAMPESGDQGERHHGRDTFRRKDRRRPQCRQARSEEHTSELQSLMRISYAVFCLKKKNIKTTVHLNRRATIPQHT